MGARRDGGDGRARHVPARSAIHPLHAGDALFHKGDEGGDVAVERLGLFGVQGGLLLLFGARPADMSVIPGEIVPDALVRSLKALADPAGLLNPGVILNPDPEAHLKHLKPLPAADPLVDKCIECGFCEPKCPSAGLTLSPRQRIASVRELARREASGQPSGRIGEDYAYMGLDTCAGCGLCSTACPVGIDTGDLTRRLRGRQLGDTARAVNAWTGKHFATLANASRLGLTVGHGHHVIGRSAQGIPCRARLPGIGYCRQDGIGNRRARQHGRPPGLSRRLGAGASHSER